MNPKWDFVIAKPPAPGGNPFRETGNFNLLNVDNLTVYSGTHTGTLVVEQQAELSGPTVLRSTLSVVGSTTLQNLTVNTFSILSGPVVARSTLSVINAASVGSLYVVANTTMVGGVEMLSNLCVNGTAHFDESLFVSGSTELVGTVSMYSDANIQLNLSVGGDIRTGSRIVSPAGYVDPEVGDIKMACVPTDRNGWLLCDGRAVNRGEYPALFSIIGTTFGSGDGVNTFNLPNAGGRVLGNVGGGHNLGEASGSDSTTLTADNLPAHTHSGTTSSNGSHSHVVSDPGHAHTQTTINDDFNNSGGATPSFAADSSGTRTWNNISTNFTGISIQANGDHTHSFTTNGGAGLNGSAFNNIQPTLFIGYTFIFAGVSGYA